VELPPPSPLDPAPQPSLVETPRASPGRPPGWHPALRIGLYLVAFVLVQVALALLLKALASLAPDSVFRAEGLASAPEILLGFIALQAPLVVGVTYVFVRFIDHGRLASIGLRWPAGGRRAALRQLAVSPLCALGLIGLWAGLIRALPNRLAALRIGSVSDSYWNGRSWWPLPPALLLALLFVLFVIQGGVEALVMRGYVYHALRERWRPAVAAVPASLLFALFHLLNPDFSILALVNIFLAGMVLAALVERTGSLWSATLAHGAWNFALSCLLSLPVSGIRIFHLLDVYTSGNQRLTGGGFGPEGSFVLTLLGAPLAFALWRGAGGRWHPRKAEDTAPSAPEDGWAAPPPAAPRDDPMAHTLQESAAQSGAADSGGPPT